MNKDPWKDLASPLTTDSINARRVDADIKWNFFWANSMDNKCLLVLQYNSNSTPQGHLPSLKGIEINISKSENGSDNLLILKLLESKNRDIFYRLCTDIIQCASGVLSEKAAVNMTLARTWRWHHLLRGGNDGLLSLEEQKGLIGELFVMERYLLPQMSVLDSVRSWHGPMGAPKDFEIGRICIEAKARRGAGSPYITINSEYQLDGSGTDQLFLFVVELDQSTSELSGGFCLSDLAMRIKEKIEDAGDDSIIAFDKRLSAAGFRWEDDYSDTLWIEGASTLYKVEGEFPRITVKMVLSGVSNIKYSISMAECEPFLTEESVLISLLRGKHND